MSDHDFEVWTADELARFQTGTNLRRPSDHQSMFKYISLNTDASWGHLRRTLYGFQLNGSPAPSLNDPFELSPYVFDDLQPSSIASAVGYNSIDERISGKKPTPLYEVFPDTEAYRIQARSYLADVVARNRIIAFCERSDSGLLWSHYANSYQGACLHFISKGFRWHRSNTLGYVNYSKHRPAYPLSLALSLSSKPGGPRISVNGSPMKRAESQKILFFTKAEDWAYEVEIRLVYDPEEAEAVKFHQDSLVAIIVGPRFSDESRLKLSQFIDGSPYKGIPIREARLSKTTFSVEIQG